MNSLLKAWATRYYYTGLGKEANDDAIRSLEDRADSVEAQYQKAFINPLTKMMGGEVSDDMIKQALMVFGNAGCTVWPYVLNYWLDNGYFKKSDSFSNSMHNCVEHFAKDNKLMYATTGINHSDFVVFANKQNKPVGDFPCRVFCYIGVSAKKGGHTLKELADKPPLSLNNSQQILLKKALEFGLLQEKHLKVDTVNIPVANGLVEPRQINACSPGLPPSEVNQLLSALPPAMVAEYPSIYFALKDYVKDKTHSQIIDKYLDSISDHFLVGAKLDYSHVTADDVKAYLDSYYGIHVDDLSQLSVNPVIVADADYANKNVSELVSAMQDSEDSTVFAGTLDEAIAKYCTHENIDTRCTIQQLIDYINYDIQIAPETHELTAEMVCAWLKASNKFDDDFYSVLDSIILNKAEFNKSMEEYIDTQKAAATYIKEADNIPEEYKVEMLEAVESGMTAPSAAEIRQNEIAIVEDYIGRLGLSNEMFVSITNAVKSGETLDLKAYTPENKVVDKINAVVETLEQIHLPKGLENAIAKAIESHLPVELPPAFAEQEKKPSMEEPGYIAGEYLLRKTRESISADSDMKNRQKYVPVLYCYLRLLMGDAVNEHNDIVEAMKVEQGKATPEVATLISDAISKF